MDEYLATLLRIERKLDILIKALAEEDELELDLEGHPIGQQREPNQPL